MACKRLPVQCIYKRASQTLDKLQGRKGSLKSIIFNKKTRDTISFRKRVYALVAETLKREFCNVALATFKQCKPTYLCEWDKFMYPTHWVCAHTLHTCMYMYMYAIPGLTKNVEYSPSLYVFADKAVLLKVMQYCNLLVKEPQVCACIYTYVWVIIVHFTRLSDILQCDKPAALCVLANVTSLLPCVCWQRLALFPVVRILTCLGEDARFANSV